ncbi:MAG: hypothetical protein JO257_31590 [Deltaproteobacteria bacterium]|nr:hypothetical protein [Deltaproteobacteria bacterium]
MPTSLGRATVAFALLLAGCGGHKGSGGGDGPPMFDTPLSGGAGSGAPTTCIVGTQGCLCDSTGGCAPGLTCETQPSPRPPLCCNGTDCSSVSGTVGGTCSMNTGAPSCTPGVTIPHASGTNDNCGYPAASFVESTTLVGIEASGGGQQPAIIHVWYNDEHALTLGCATASNPVTPLSPDPAAVHYPQTGDPACTDTMARPLRPVIFITDLSVDPSCKAGDMQNGGPAYDPVAIFGSWKSAAEDASHVGTPATADPAANHWNLTTQADPVPAMVMSKGTQAYSTELRFEVGLISGHSYRIQVIAHDGDQNHGGDSGELCATFCAGTGMLCDPGVIQCVDNPDGASCPNGTSCVQGCCLPVIQ